MAETDKIYISEKYGFSIDVPKSWELTVQPDRFVYLSGTSKSGEVGEERGQFTIVVERIGDEESETIFASSFKAIKAHVPGFKLRKEGLYRDNAYQNKWWTYDFDDNLKRLSILTSVYIVDSVEYSIHCSSVSSEFEHYLPKFKKIAKSFRMKK